MKRQRLLCLLLAVIVPVGSAPTVLASSPSATVVLNIFSGLPDPTWPLRTAQVQALQTSLEALPEGDPADLPGGLGYRGFTVTGNTLGELRVFDGYVRWTTDNSVRWLHDATRSLEIWLLDSAGDRIPAKLASSLLAKFTGGFAIYLPAQDLTPFEAAHADLETLALHRLRGEPAPQAPPGAPMPCRSTQIHTSPRRTPENRACSERVRVVGSEPIYPGAFWASFSSMAYTDSVVDILYGQMDLPMKFQLGYPASPELYTGEDWRADPRILAAFEAAGKLK